MIRYHVFLAGIFISWFLGQSAFIFGEVTSPLWHHYVTLTFLAHHSIPSLCTLSLDRSLFMLEPDKISGALFTRGNKTSGGQQSNAGNRKSSALLPLASQSFAAK